MRPDSAYDQHMLPWQQLSPSWRGGALHCETVALACVMTQDIPVVGMSLTCRQPDAALMVSRLSWLSA